MECPNCGSLHISITYDNFKIEFAPFNECISCGFRWSNNV